MPSSATPQPNHVPELEHHNPFESIQVTGPRKSIAGLGLQYPVAAMTRARIPKRTIALECIEPLSSPTCQSAASTQDEYPSSLMSGVVEASMVVQEALSNKETTGEAKSQADEEESDNSDVEYFSCQATPVEPRHALPSRPIPVGPETAMPPFGLTSQRTASSSGPRPMSPSHFTRGSAPLTPEQIEEKRGQVSASTKRQNATVSSVERKKIARSTIGTQTDDNPFLLMGTVFAGIDTERFIKGTPSNQLAMERLEAGTIHGNSDSESDEEKNDDSIQETPIKLRPRPRQASRPNLRRTRQLPIPRASSQTRAAQSRASSSRALKSHAPFSRGSAPLTPPQYEKRSGSTNVNTSQHSKLWTEFASSGLSTPETPARKGAGISQGKKKEREIKSLPSPPPSDSASRIRRIAQQPGSSRTPAGASANPPTFGPARPPAKANRQSSPETFLPIPIVGIPGLSYTLDEFDTVYNRKTGGRQYKLLNGELLKEYQTIDVDREMAASMYRHCLRVEKGRGRPVARDPDELVQGVLLNYETGLGKTHVASVLIDRGRVHRKKINESLGVPDLPLKQDLIIAPLSTHNHWEEHLTRLSEGRLTVKIWVPSSRGAFDPEVDVYIITIESFRNHHHRFGTYQDMIDERHELNPAENPKRDWSLGLTEDDMAWVMSKAPFAVTEFNTIVVDESHDARNSASLGARALLSARADSFLLLTGTPAQNTLDDLQINFSLMVHRSKRHDFREAEKQNRKLNKDRKMKGEKARSLPMHADEVLGTRFNGTKEIEHFMNNCMVTRRSRCPEQGTALVELPKLHRVRVEVLQNIQEKELGHYVAALTDCDGPLVRILRERQVVLHGNLVRKVTCPRVVDEAMMDEDVTDNLQVISYNVLPSDLKFLKIDSDDIQEAIETSLKRELPSELKGMGLDQLLEPKYIPSKFKAVYAIIEKVPEGEKVLIFSNFTSLLDLLAEFLEDNDIGNIQFDGRMNSRERETALRTIANDIDVKVMLVSMKAGGVGLNITACNHIILFDSWWNPYVEEQAISRAHRIGQTRECHVYRLHSPDTIEDRIVKVATQKRGPIEAFMARCAVLTNERDAVQRASFESSRGR